MDIQLEKYKLVEGLIGLKDEAIITKIKQVKDENEEAWSIDVSEAEKTFIKAGLKDLKQGKTYSHDQVMEEVSKAYGL
ncbi:hypothetical protein BXY82_1138 [Gelidibacter sediminis]|uniref:Addiction module component n=1 Tax=Gelidibacter sediminis TaxID=1608710 RepID=A0A4R7QA10_9FLAO|nr:hypothetical protein [Gelidibacter sediminis]TDU43721.1 hypothetical protein BXY82_1138 [Gelidibacter sediminis]